MKIVSGIRVMAWNLCDAGDTPERLRLAVDTIEAYKPDVAFFPEVAGNHDSEDDKKRNQDIRKQLEDIGLGTSVIIPYDDERNRHFMTMAVGGSVKEVPEPVSFGDRNAWRVQTSVGRVIGIHADDRDERSRRRSILSAIGDEPAVMIGDFNAMVHDAPRASLLRAASNVCALFGLDTVDPYDDTSRMKRIVGKAVRLGGMADSEILSIAESHGFFAADDDMFIPTIGGTRWGFAIDHVLYKRGLVAVPIATRFEPVSDHRPVVADVYMVA